MIGVHLYMSARPGKVKNVSPGAVSASTRTRLSTENPRGSIPGSPNVVSVGRNQGADEDQAEIPPDSKPSEKMNPTAEDAPKILNSTTTPELEAAT